MSNSMVASHSKGKVLKDKIFGASAAANQAAAKYGKDKVVNATIGAIMDDNGVLACIPTVEKVMHSMPINDMIAYAPISGLPDYLQAVINLAFADNKPEACFSAVATAGGTGALHNAIQNYTEAGDTVITSDWFWGTYNIFCQEAGRKLDTYELFDQAQNFNIHSFEKKFIETLNTQSSIMAIINTPAHNPTGYSLTEEEWDEVLDICKDQAKNESKKITLLVDMAYIDYAGDKNESRKFMRKFSNLPENILVILAFSMSKGYTMYGQRTGAMIAVSASQDIVDEFEQVNKYTSRATWSNINRGAMHLLTTIDKDRELLAQFEAERDVLDKMIQKRANVFMTEAKECGLNVLPYRAGFFISVPADDPDAVCERLRKDLIFAVPLKMGVRIAVCSVSEEKIKGVAAKVLAAMNFVAGK